MTKDWLQSHLQTGLSTAGPLGPISLAHGRSFGNLGGPVQPWPVQPWYLVLQPMFLQLSHKKHPEGAERWNIVLCIVSNMQYGQTVYWKYAKHPWMVTSGDTTWYFLRFFVLGHLVSQSMFLQLGPKKHPDGAERWNMLVLCIVSNMQYGQTVYCKYAKQPGMVRRYDLIFSEVFCSWASSHCRIVTFSWIIKH